MIITEKEQPLPQPQPFKWWQILVFLFSAIVLWTIWSVFAQTTMMKSIIADAPGMALFLLFVVGLAAFYFMPWAIGRRRDISTVGPLFIVNLGLGWTVIGWFACLIWAATGATKAQDEFYRAQADRNK